MPTKLSQYFQTSSFYFTTLDWFQNKPFLAKLQQLSNCFVTPARAPASCRLLFLPCGNLAAPSTATIHQAAQEKTLVQHILSRSVGTDFKNIRNKYWVCATEGTQYWLNIRDIVCIRSRTYNQDKISTLRTFEVRCCLWRSIHSVAYYVV